MVTIEGSIVILVVGIALVLIARLIAIETIVNKILYIIGIILVIVGLLFLVFAVVGGLSLFVGGALL